MHGCVFTPLCWLLADCLLSSLLNVVMLGAGAFRVLLLPNPYREDFGRWRGGMKETIVCLLENGLM